MAKSIGDMRERGGAGEVFLRVREREKKACEGRNKREGEKGKESREWRGHGSASPRDGNISVARGRKEREDGAEEIERM